MFRAMLKIVNQTTYTIQYVIKVLPSGPVIASGRRVEPNKIATYRIDDNPSDRQSASNCRITTCCVDDPTPLEERGKPAQAPRGR